jgi:chromosome segregation protein
MKLTRLRLLGFKSFVEPTDFMIEPGLTGVVGPNGCGKSNLVEALRWVMGESSYKSMRASSMDDVIFSGSNSRPARNNAEVAIAIDNSTRSAPSAFNDQDSLEIARRIERDSGSNYRINGREVRARDVQILFADASIGACWKRLPVLQACMPAGMRPSCGSRRLKPIFCGSKTSSASSRRKSMA